MKKKLFVFIISLLPFYGSAQDLFDVVCTDFEDNTSFISNLTGCWQIGHASKVIFSDDYSATNSIITDTTLTYANNDTSFFYAVYAPWYFESYLNSYYPFTIDFYHRFDTDSLLDYGSIELSIDGGNTWIDGLSNEFGLSYTPEDNAHVFLSSGDTVHNGFTITGSSNGWVHSTITTCLDCWFYEDGFSNEQIDSLIVKFTFKSDSIDNLKEGWQIDNLCLTYRIYSTVGDEGKSENSIEIYPNPFSSQTSIVTKSFLNNATWLIFNSSGELVRQINNIYGQNITFHRDELPAGIYNSLLEQDNKIIAASKLVIIE